MQNSGHDASILSMGKMWWLLGLTALVGSGCGTGVKTLGEVKKDEKGSCPAAAHIPYHEITAHFSKTPPAKLAVILDGEEKINECERPEEKPPIVRIKRESGNAMVLTVAHHGAYRSLPREVSFQILDLGKCQGDEPLLFSEVNKLPIVFETDYPNGKDCGSRTYAKMQVYVQ